MRAIFAALVLIAPLAACEESNPTFGSGGWQEGDVEEAVPVGDEPMPTAGTPAATPSPPSPPRPTAPEPATETPEAVATVAEPAPPPPIIAPASPLPVVTPTPDPHAGHQMPSEAPPATP